MADICAVPAAEDFTVATVQAKGDWQSATECCGDALALSPKHPEASLLLGQLYLERAKLDDLDLAEVSLCFD